jgi:hypothetical protein
MAAQEACAAEVEHQQEVCEAVAFGTPTRFPETVDSLEFAFASPLAPEEPLDGEMPDSPSLMAQVCQLVDTSTASFFPDKTHVVLVLKDEPPPASRQPKLLRREAAPVVDVASAHRRRFDASSLSRNRPSSLDDRQSHRKVGRSPRSSTVGRSPRSSKVVTPRIEETANVFNPPPSMEQGAVPFTSAVQYAVDI